jgi:hypothetical protein
VPNTPRAIVPDTLRAAEDTPRAVHKTNVCFIFMYIGLNPGIFYRRMFKQRMMHLEQVQNNVLLLKSLLLTQQS